MLLNMHRLVKYAMKIYQGDIPISGGDAYQGGGDTRIPILSCGMEKQELHWIPLIKTHFKDITPKS